MGIKLTPLSVTLYLMILLFAFSSCANYKLNYGPEAEGWENQQPEQGKEIEHTMYLIGDAGYTQSGQTPPALRLLETKLQDAGRNTSVVFLGDNIYPDGMAPKSKTAEREIDEYRLRAQLDVLQGFRGKPFFVAGNHDWYEYGIDGLERQQEFIEKYLGRSDVWEPNPGCGDPEEIELSGNLVLILLDTQWWLANWEGEPKVNEGCVIKSREEFWIYLEDAIKGNRSKNIVLAMHHPVFSNGPHGGEFRVRDHLFPLTNLHENLWLPLPLIGSLYPFLRSTVGSKQDLAHPEYRDLKDILITSARKSGSFIFAAGHEHSLQYLEKEEQYFIVSGSGSKRSAAKTGNGALFAYGGHGFAQLDFYADGSAWVQYWVSEGNGSSGRVAFRKQIKGPLPGLNKAEPYDFSFYNSDAGYLEMEVGAYDYSRNAFGRFLWGNHYRDAYAATVNIPKLDLESFQGGVRPVKRGGGFQTNSLRLETDDGRQYTMRSVDKDPTRTVAYPLNQSRIVLDIIKDSFSGAHPLSATPLPLMQDSLNLYHTNPKLYYVPKQPRLENFNKDYGDALYLVEERPDDDVWEEQASFGYPDEILSTEDVIEEVHEHHDHVIDQNWVLRARLFDVVIGDWDRHDDQWRWAEFDTLGNTLYRPIPRDRDQAFGKYDGFIFSFVRQASPLVRALRDFKPFQPRIKWSNFGARSFDPTFLSAMSWEDWEREIKYIQQHLTDNVIERAVREAWPPELYRLDGPTVIETVKARRDNLLRMGRDLYEHRAREVDVVGTNERDLFLVERMDNGLTKIRVFDTNKEGEQEMLFYERTFDRKDTKEISLYGLDDEDIFQVKGKVRNGIKIRLIGGLQDDTFTDESRVSGLSKKTIVYDAKSEKRNLTSNPETRVRISGDPQYNIYNRRSKDYNFDFWTFLPSLAFNPDDGFLLGGSVQFTHYGYKKHPYAGKHFLSAKYAFATGGAEFIYNSEWIDAVGDFEIGIDGIYRSPLYSVNFYGIGNETLNREDTLGVDYHRVRQREILFSPALKKRVNSATSFSFGPTFESIEVERTEGRFIDDYAKGEDDPFDEAFFEGQQFLGLRFTFDFSNLDDANYPALGVNLFVDAGWRVRADNFDRNFPYLEGFISAFQPLDSRRRLVLGTRIGGRHLFNDEFEFYQAATLGGTGQRANFRGFRRDRFTGKSAFYQNVDLRWEMLRSGNISLPFTMGLLAGFDHGRVWTPEEDSRKWHIAYGGGVFISPLDLLTAQLSAFRGDEEAWRFVFTGKFLF